MAGTEFAAQYSAVDAQASTLRLRARRRYSSTDLIDAKMALAEQIEQRLHEVGHQAAWLDGRIPPTRFVADVQTKDSLWSLALVVPVVASAAFMPWDRSIAEATIHVESGPLQFVGHGQASVTWGLWYNHDAERRAIAKALERANADLTQVSPER